VVKKYQYFSLNVKLENKEYKNGNFNRKFM